jgi:hypothetical protein
MPSIRQSIRSSTASKRPTSAIADGQIALNTASGTPGLFFKDNANNIIKAGPAHYGASAPNSSPAVGGSTGNSIGEAWLDSSLTPAGWKIWDGSAWVNATPLSSDTVQGLVELATNAETQAGVDAARAVTAASLQSKVSDSISTTSASGIASSTAVKTAYDLANAALPKSGGIVTGNLEIGSTGSFTFEGSTADGFETTLAVVDPTADRTITFPNITGTVVTTGDSGTVTSTMILDGAILNADINASAAIAFSKLATLSSANILVGNASGVPTSTAVTGDVTITNSGVTAIASNVIVNADINSSAAIADTKLATIATALKVSNSATTAASANTASGIVARDGSGNFSAGTITAALTGAASSNVLKAGDTMTGVLAVTAGTAALPGIAVSGDLNTGIYSPGADQIGISTGGTSRIVFDASGNVNIDSNTLYVDAANNRVGIGTTAPGQLLQIEGASDPAVLVKNTASNVQAYFYASSNAGVFGTPTVHPLVFNVENLEKARIDTSGRLLVGTIASPAYQLQVSTDSAGKPSSALWTIVSDERIKEDIELADLDLCYEAIKSIPLKRYKWRDEIYTAEQVTDRRKLGWIAQDVEAIFPKAVGTHEFKYNQVFEETIIPAVEQELDADGNVITPAQPERTEQGDLISEDVIEDCRDLNSDQIYAAMYGAVQKLIAKVETLEASNADLLARVVALEAA